MTSVVPSNSTCSSLPVPEQGNMGQKNISQINNPWDNRAQHPCAALAYSIFYLGLGILILLGFGLVLLGAVPWIHGVAVSLGSYFLLSTVGDPVDCDSALLISSVIWDRKNKDLSSPAAQLSAEPSSPSNPSSSNSSSVCQSLAAPLSSISQLPELNTVSKLKSSPPSQPQRQIPSQEQEHDDQEELSDFILLPTTPKKKERIDSSPLFIDIDPNDESRESLSEESTDEEQFEKRDFVPDSSLPLPSLTNSSEVRDASSLAVDIDRNDESRESLSEESTDEEQFEKRDFVPDSSLPLPSLTNSSEDRDAISLPVDIDRNDESRASLGEELADEERAEKRNSVNLTLPSPERTLSSDSSLSEGQRLARAKERALELVDIFNKIAQELESNRSIADEKTIQNLQACIFQNSFPLVRVFTLLDTVEEAEEKVRKAEAFLPSIRESAEVLFQCLENDLQDENIIKRRAV